MNRNIGRTEDANNGLILQAKPEITTSEAGLTETTLVFHVRDDVAASVTPTRGTKCSDFVSGSARTTALLADLDYLAAQSSKFVPGGFCVGKGGNPGIGILQVLCQGAVFGTSDPSPVERIDVTDGGEYTAEPIITITGGDEVTPASAEPQMALKNIVVHYGGTGFSPGNLIDLVDGSGTQGTLRLVVQTVTGGAITSVAIIRADPIAVLPPNPVPLWTGDATFDLTWLLASINITDGGSYIGTPDADADGGLYTTRATLGAVHMGGFARFGAITKPLTPVTTVKDTVEIPIFSDPEKTILVSKVTIGYAAIELSFEYVAQHFLDSPRFIGDEYQLVDGQKMLIDPIDGTTMLLRIAAVSAIAQVTDTNGTVTDGKPIAIDEATWRAAIRYIGDASQFQQVQAGAMWHVTETTTIRIFAKLSPLPPAPPPPPPYKGPWWD